MTLEELNRKDAEISAHALRAIKAAKKEKQTRDDARAAVNEALTLRDNARGDLLRAFLKA
jgi:hypothetical protein